MKVINSKNSIIVITSQIITAIIGLIFGKLVAVYIKPSELGIFTLQFGIYTLIFTLFFSPTVQFYKSTINSLYSKIGFKFYKFSLVISSIVALLFITFFLSLFDNSNFEIVFISILILFIPFNAIFNILNDFNNVVGNIQKYIFGNLVKSLVSLLTLLIFVKFLTIKIQQSKILWIVQLSGLILGVIVLYSKSAIRNKKILVSYKNFLKRKFEFGIPLMFMTMASWVTNYIDRYIINYYLDAQQVGIYNANYSLGSKFFLFLSPIFLILLTPIVYNRENIELRKIAINKFARIYFLISVPILIILFLLKDLVGSILLSESYSDGFYLIFWFALAFFIVGISQFYELLFYAEKRTKLSLSSNLISALINLILNIGLVPIYGLTGAMIATVISFIGRLVFIYFKFQRI